ncbi:MAG TPA: ABC transporter permease [Acidimicrobiales bacterium]
MRQLRAAGLIAGLDLRRRVRNRSFVIQGVVGPVALAGIISLAFGGGGGLDMTLGVVDADGSELGEGVVAALTDLDPDSGLTFEAVDTVAEARRLIEDGDHDAGLVLPEGFAASLATDEPEPIVVLADGDGQVAAEVAEAVAGDVTTRANASRLAVATAAALDRPTPDPAVLAGIELPVGIEQTGTGGESSPAAYFGPSIGLFFLFLSVGAIARDLLAEQRTGTVDRVRAGPVGTGAVIAGKGLSVIVVGVTSLLVIWAATTLLLGADWGDPLGVVVLVTAAALAVAGVAGLVAAVARTEQAAENLATGVGFVFALLGGAFMPPGLLPDAMERVAVLTPMGWALRGFAELSAGRGDVGDIVTPVGVLLLWAVVTGALAVRLLPGRLESR